MAKISNRYGKSIPVLNVLISRLQEVRAWQEAG